MLGTQFISELLGDVIASLMCGCTSSCKMEPTISNQVHQ
uniref:Uncharacterized protein n=1 Tax=Timema monikensis TaxID=170555 RepID=A0A7R9EJI4_9NEOP|nr:unnamed protein product [Timema monikensis]